MKTLVVIFGQVRTLSSCVLSIYDKILLTNRPCSVVLAIDGKYQDIPKDVIDLLSPFLLDIYVTHNRENVQRDHQIIEFFLVSKALERVNIDDFQFMLKIRTDIFIRYPICIKTIYGMCSQQQFQKTFEEFCTKLSLDWKSNPLKAITSYLFTGSLKFFITRQLDKNNPPRSPWSTKNIYEWNNTFITQLSEIFERMQLRNQKPTLAYIHNLVRKLCQDFHIVYLLGSTWIHFGYAKDLYELSNLLLEKHTTMKWPNVYDDQEMEWTDHKNEKRTMIQSEWRKITDDQMRMVHHLHNYTLIDLVNPADYVESFDAVYTHQINKKRPDLFAWIVRSHRL